MVSCNFLLLCRFLSGDTESVSDLCYSVCVCVRVCVCECVRKPTVALRPGGRCVPVDYLCNKILCQHRNEVALQ